MQPFSVFLMMLLSFSAADSAKMHITQGVELGKQGNYQGAEQEFREAIRLDPKSAEAYSNLSVALLRRVKLAEAEESSRQALRIKPGYAVAYYNLACCYALQSVKDKMPSKKEKALLSLSVAVKNGFDDWFVLDHDEDLNSIKDDSRFKKMAEKVKKRWEKKQKDKGKGR